MVVRAVVGEKALIVKRRKLEGVRQRVANRAHASRAFRQWRGIKLLVRAGIPVSRPVAVVSRRGHCEWLVLEEVPGETALALLTGRALSVRDQHAAARAVGVQASTLLRAGLTNRDHKLSNIVVSMEDGVPLVTLIDTVAIRRRGNPGELVRMLATLLIEAIGVQHPPRGAIAFRALRDACAAWLEATLGRPLGAHKGDRKALRALVRSTARRIDQYVRTHGDPTPEVSPLETPKWPDR